MGVKDLLWACPHCGAEDALEERGREAACTACGATLQRAQGAKIRMRAPDGSVTTGPAASFLDRIPSPTVLLGRGRDPLREARISLRTAESEGVARISGKYLNRYEKLGDPVEGRLRLHRDRVVFRPDEGSATIWPFDALTAVQPSSSTLQLKGRNRPVCSIRFHDDSVRLWEELLMGALQAFYDARGWGEIAEFQPRIVTR